MNALPVFLDLAGRRALLLGEGEAADRRADTLLECGAILVRAADFRDDLLDGCAIAIGAAEGEARAEDHPMQAALRAMAAAARARGIPCNVVDQPELGSFTTPAVVMRPPLSIAISSGGASPVLARLLRARIEALVPPGYGRLAALAGRLQAQTRRALPEVLQRRRMLEAALSGQVATLMLEGREAEAEAAYMLAMRQAADGFGVAQPGFVHLVHTGPGEADLLTLRALRLLGEADVIVHRPDESPAVLEVARRDAGRRAVVDADAPGLLVELAREGGKIVRLSPTALDFAALATSGIDHAVVPGIGVHAAGLTRAPAACSFPPMSRLDHSRPFLPVRIALLTVSDTRTAANDSSGDILADRILAAGHVLADRAIARDDVGAIAALLSGWIADAGIDVVISTGGTGLTGRDVTPEAYERVIEKRIEGFGELFRMLSYQKIGTSTIQSRALAGVARGTYLFALPGSSGAVRDGWDDILVWQLDSRHAPCNFVELMPRLTEK